MVGAGELVAVLRGNVTVEASVPDGTATDPALLATKINQVLSEILAISGIDFAQLDLVSIRLTGP